MLTACGANEVCRSGPPAVFRRDTAHPSHACILRRGARGLETPLALSPCPLSCAMLAPALLPAAAPRCGAARRIRASSASCAAPRAPVAAAACVSRSSCNARRHSQWRCASSAADNVASGPVGAAQPLQPPPVAAAELPALAELSKVRWYECLAGVTYVVLMSEVRRPRPRRCTQKARACNPRTRCGAHPVLTRCCASLWRAPPCCPRSCSRERCLRCCLTSC